MKPFAKLKDAIFRLFGRISALFYVKKSGLDNVCEPKVVGECDAAVGSAHREMVLSLKNPGIYFPKLYQIVKNLFALIRSVAYGGKYVFCITAVAFLCWLSGNQSAGIIAMLILSTVAMFATRDIMPAVLPILLLGFVVPAQTASSDFISDYVVAITFSMIGFVAAVAYVLSAKPLTLGEHFWPYLAMSVAFIVAGLGFESYNSSTIFQLGVTTLVFVFYFVARNGVRTFNKLYLVKIFAALAILITAEIIVYYLRCKDISTAINLKTLDLGWGISNCAAAALMITIPICLYGFLNTKRLTYLATMLVGYVGIIMTLSRGCMLIAALFLPVILGVIFVNSKNKRQMAVVSAVIVAVIAIVLLIIEELCTGIIERLLKMGFSDSGRLNIYKTAISDFLSSPVFGVGVHNPRDPYGSIYWYHSTPLQFLACAGVVGIAAYGFHLVKLGQRLLRALSKPFNQCILLAIVQWGIYGYMDVNFFFPCQAFCMAILIVFHEQHAEELGLKKGKITRNFNKM